MGLFEFVVGIFMFLLSAIGGFAIMHMTEVKEGLKSNVTSIITLISKVSKLEERSENHAKITQESTQTINTLAVKIGQINPQQINEQLGKVLLLEEKVNHYGRVLERISKDGK